MGRTVRVDAHQRGGGRTGVLHQSRRPPLLDEQVEIESEIADVGAPLGVHHHVVPVEGGGRFEVSVFDELAICFETQHGTRLAGHHQKASVRHPADPRRLTGDLELDPDRPCLVGRLHGAVVEVDEPQPTVVPAWALAEVEAVYERLGHPGRGVVDGGLDHAILRVMAGFSVAR